MKFTKQEAHWAAVKSNFKYFLMQCFHEIYPGKTFLDNWHIDAIVHCLEQGIEGKMPRLIINLPPRHLKSFIVSVALPAFILGRDPTAKIICVSYSDDLAKMLSRDFGRIMESKWYKRLFPQVRRTKMTESEFATDLGGTRYATSVGGTLTGRGGDFIIIDDPIKPVDALSDRARVAANEWYTSTLLSRLDDKQRSILIIVMQRLHVNDLTGFVESSGGFHKLAFSAIAIKNEKIPVSDTELHVRHLGEALHGEMEGLETLNHIRDQIGPSNFSSQYQQQPECPEGALFKKKYFQIIDNPDQIKPGGFYWISIDSALSTSETADYSAISVGYSNEDGHYVLFSERGRWDYEALQTKSLFYARRHPGVTFIVEAAGSGISLIQYLRKRLIPCFHHQPTREKMVRAALVLPIFHAGRVYILNKQGENNWVEPYINELLSFPNGRFDDQVDSLVQALNWAEPRANPGGRCYTI